MGSEMCIRDRTHTRQNKPYRRLGAVRAGVVGERGRCCPAATVPVADVFPCGVCCCIAENIQNKIINRKTELCHHRPQTKARSNVYENNTHKAEQALLAWRGAGRSSRGTRPRLSSSDGARSCRNRPCCLMMYSSKKQKKRNDQHQVSPFYSKVDIFREGLVSAKGE